MLKFLGILIEMGLVQMQKLEYYWSNSQLYGSEIIRSAMARDSVRILYPSFAFISVQQLITHTAATTTAIYSQAREREERERS